MFEAFCLLRSIRQAVGTDLHCRVKWALNYIDRLIFCSFFDNIPCGNWWLTFFEKMVKSFDYSFRCSCIAPSQVDAWRKLPKSSSGSRSPLMNLRNNARNESGNDVSVGFLGYRNEKLKFTSLVSSWYNSQLLFVALLDELFQCHVTMNRRNYRVRHWHLFMTTAFSLAAHTDFHKITKALNSCVQ